MKKLKTAVGVILILIIGGFTFSIINSPISVISIVQRTGIYSFCEMGQSYKFRCIAETEFQETLKVDYECNSVDVCSSPQCFSYVDCGRGGGKDFGCPIEAFCTVDQTWLCVETGGVVTDFSDSGKRHGGNNVCLCPKDSNFINGYGCAACGEFDHEETRDYCNNPINGGYFRKLD